MTRKFFIHIPKNGGMTIRRSPHLQNRIQVATPDTHRSKIYTAAVAEKMKATRDHPGYEHARYTDIDTRLHDAMDFFAIVRNPWDRVVSRYFFAKKVIEVERKVPKDYANVSSFEAFLDERLKWGYETYMWHRAVRGWYNAFEHVCDHDGQTVACDIMRFDRFNDDIVRYFGLPPNTVLQPRNVTALNKGTYKDLYTPKTIQIVGDWYKKDIEYWGFDFDTGPTRNTYFND